MATINWRVVHRRGTAGAWTTKNPVLAAGEKGVETDTGKEKTGDGVTAWTALPYITRATELASAQAAAAADATTKANAAQAAAEATAAAELSTAVASEVTRANATYAPYVVADETGVLDALAAINAALSTGDKVCRLKPNATYKITDSIRLQSGCKLIGGGPTTVIRLADDAVTTGYLGIVNADTTNGNDDIHLADFTLDCNRANQPSANATGVRFLASDANSCDRIRVEGLHVKNVSHAGMQFMNCKYLHVVGNRVENTVRDGITVWYNSRHVTIHGNDMVDVRDDGIALNSEVTGHTGTQIRFVSIVGNTVAQHATSTLGGGIRIAGAEDVTCEGNVVEFAQGWGIVVEGGFVSGASMPSVRVAVVGNTIKAAGNATSGAGGIATTAASSRITVSGNVVDGYYSNGIQLAGPASVTGNVVGTGVATTGLGILATAQFTTIAGNHVRRAQSHAVQVGAEKVTVASNVLEEPGQGNTGAAGVLVVGNVNRVAVNGNIFRRTTTGTYGVRIATGTSGQVVVVGNVAQGHTAGNAYSDGSSSGLNVIANNADG